MYLVYTPAEGDVQRYQFDPNSMPNFDAEAIERVTGWTLGEWGEKIQKGSVLATRALLWVLQRRTHPTLKFANVEFTTDQVSSEAEPAELIAARDAALEDDELTEDKRRIRLDAIYAEMDKAGIARDTTAPKAPAKNSA